MNNKLKFAIIIIVVIVVIFTIASWMISNLLHDAQPVSGKGVYMFTVAEGMSLSQIAENLESRGLIHSASRFKWAARLKGAERKIQPGAFTLDYGLTNSEIIDHLLLPGDPTTNVTIPEGLTIRQIAGILQKEMGIDSARFVSLCEDSILIADLGINAKSLEGYLFPDTYNFFSKSGEIRIIRRICSQFFTVFDDEMKSAAQKTGFTVHEAVTLASIIEGEIIMPDEARNVSAVYHNRLKRGMLLGADPTIQYIIPDGPRRLLNGDLEIDNPYNTYKYRGLPPGPINNPGRVALEAAVNPADVDYIYFVARGDGSHAFNSTHAGHQRDKARLQQIRREVAREKRQQR